MKILLIPLIAVFLSLNFKAHSQVNNDSTSHHFDNHSVQCNLLLEKSHNQKVTSIVLGVAGVGTSFVGIALALSSLDNLFVPGAHHNNYGSAPDILFFGGLTLIAAGVAFTISSKQNKKKAMLCLRKEEVITGPAFKSTALVSIGIRVKFK